VLEILLAAQHGPIEALHVALQRPQIADDRAFEHARGLADHALRMIQRGGDQVRR